MPPNHYPGLRPSGGGWRGSTFPPEAFPGWPDPHTYEEKYGSPVHMIRIFRANGADTVIDGYKEWACATGGIMYPDAPGPRTPTPAAQPAHHLLLTCCGAISGGLSYYSIVEDDWDEIVNGTRDCIPTHRDLEPPLEQLSPPSICY